MPRKGRFLMIPGTKPGRRVRKTDRVYGAVVSAIRATVEPGRWFCVRDIAWPFPVERVNELLFHMADYGAAEVIKARPGRRCKHDPKWTAFKLL